ncbi:MAG TPA: GlsB/YeaQ/YmgE family stress response membrane protein [Gaiellaceae bacterium]|nr:GlsB/YeaQ/YmgE family stress response membrane protein [Gaiellaceae bacterium]
MHWIWFILVGAVVGALGRLLHPGRDPMGWLLTIGIGIVSMIIAAAISSGWLAFVIGVVVAVVLVALVGRFFGDRRRGVLA